MPFFSPYSSQDVWANLSKNIGQKSKWKSEVNGKQFQQRLNMLAKDLIKLLEELIERHKPAEDMMGPCQITIDVFSESKEHPGLFKYRGINNDQDIKITYTADGVYPVLTAFMESQDVS